jgi:hypothetical protein
MASEAYSFTGCVRFARAVTRSAGMSCRGRNSPRAALTEEQEKRLWINRSRRGWHRSEPLDDSTPPEQPTLMSKSFKMILEAKVKCREQIVKGLNFSGFDIENFGSFPKCFIIGRPAEGEPHFKTLPANVLPLRR